MNPCLLLLLLLLKFVMRHRTNCERAEKLTARVEMEVLQEVDSAVTPAINSCWQPSGSESTSPILEPGEMPISVPSVRCESSHSMKSEVSSPTLSRVLSSSDIHDKSSERPEIKDDADTAPRPRRNLQT